MSGSDPLAEYTVRDFSAVESQIQQIADREKVVTQKLRIANYKQICILAGGMVMTVGVFLLFAGIAYRIAFPPQKTKIVETTKVVEKIIQPPETNIVIQTPAGSGVLENADGSKIISTLSETNSSTASEMTGDAANAAIAVIDERLSERGVTTTGSSIQASLSWDNFNDLDLMVREPNGNLVWFKQKQAPSGGKLDIDANARIDKRTNRPVENITWEPGTAISGKYELLVGFYARDERVPVDGDTTFTVKLKTANGESVFSDKFSNDKNQQKKLVHEFQIGSLD